MKLNETVRSIAVGEHDLQMKESSGDYIEAAIAAELLAGGYGKLATRYKMRALVNYEKAKKAGEDCDANIHMLIGELEIPEKESGKVVTGKRVVGEIWEIFDGIRSDSNTRSVADDLMSRMEKYQKVMRHYPR